MSETQLWLWGDLAHSPWLCLKRLYSIPQRFHSNGHFWTPLQLATCTVWKWVMGLKWQAHTCTSTEEVWRVLVELSPDGKDLKELIYLSQITCMIRCWRHNLNLSTLWKILLLTQPRIELTWSVIMPCCKGVNSKTGSIIGFVKISRVLTGFEL